MTKYILKQAIKLVKMTNLSADKNLKQSKRIKEKDLKRYKELVRWKAIDKFINTILTLLLVGGLFWIIRHF